MTMIEKTGRGVVVYLRGHEGRGIGLGHKLQAYNLQDDGRDTVEANLELGLPADSREYGIGAQILRHLGARTMRLMTNNPAKYTGLKGYGLSVLGRVPLLTPITTENRRYMETKRLKMGHVYGSRSSNHANGSGLADVIGRSSAVSSPPDLRRPPVAVAAERRPASMSATSQQTQGQASWHRIAADHADRSLSVAPMMYQDPLSMIDDYR
ncbi:Monofunctional riboflavin biosynthesis protein RIBA 3 chloroplastic [Zea mays]|uniref:GTP cyclohydrolase II n=1 Tax=Zea mays TaxID=4577 RepID=A0A1D6KHL6_MAIZE|nr:Monofunctional riboflavin biosynthesis protein RIBA 3 chloroplastic [Zea mays]ONM02509.1 Monofunctional riboflavin biosynthesis protein RIBA 3 chloroplastic [Zea mays]ONM02510.1 Monofunctional riboflavin biosynthesis protein RIBA 3 chloroplastic [Zea mays]ONM02511.1 Monofunctional riboflavin biosynthesis protein RIBA 3 chloroplastic [Zea mays]